MRTSDTAKTPRCCDPRPSGTDVRYGQNAAISARRPGRAIERFSASPRGMRLHDRHRTDDPGTRGLTKSSSTHCSALGGRALAALPSASTAARSLHRSGSPCGSLRDQVSRRLETCLRTRSQASRSAHGCGDTLMSLTTCLWPRSASAWRLAARAGPRSASNPPTAKDSAQLQTHPDVPDNLPLSAGPASLRFGPRLAARVGSGSASDLRVERDHRALRSARGAKAPALSAQQTLLRIGLVAGCVRRFSLGFELCPRTCATNVHVSAWREDTFRLP